MQQSETTITIDLNPREQRLYDRLRAVVVAPSPRATSGVKDLLLLLPDVVVLLSRLMRDERVPLGSKVIALLGVGYTMLPVDLVPEIVFGPIGLVDDLLIVTAALSRLLKDVHPDVVRSHWPGKGDALDTIQRLTDWAERQVRAPIVAWLRRIVRLGR